MPVSMPTVWFAAHAGSRSLAVVFVNLGHPWQNLLVVLLKEGENRRDLVAAFLYKIGFPQFRYVSNGGINTLPPFRGCHCRCNRQ